MHGLKMINRLLLYSYAHFNVPFCYDLLPIRHIILVAPASLLAVFILYWQERKSFQVPARGCCSEPTFSSPQNKNGGRSRHCPPFNLTSRRRQPSLPPQRSPSPFSQNPSSPYTPSSPSQSTP